MHRRLLALLAAASLALPAAPALAQLDTGHMPGEGMEPGVGILIILGQWENDPVGIGTRVSGAGETFIAKAEVEEMVGLGGRLYVPLQGGTSLTFTLSGSSGEDTARVSAPAGGPDDFGFTFLAEQPLSGGGTSTGLFVGNSWDVEARAEARAERWTADVEYDLGLDGPFTRGLSLGVTLDSWDQRGDAAGTFSNGGFDIDSETRTRLEDWAFGMSVMYGADATITPELIAWFKGEVGASVRNSEGSVVQTTSCGFCGPDLQSVEQRIEVDDSAVLAQWGVEIGARYSLTDDWTLEIGARAANDGPGGFDIPANPDQQPAGYNDDPTVTVNGWAALNYRW